MLTSLPNLLTLSRIAVIPLVVATFYVPGGDSQWVAAALFTAACITEKNQDNHEDRGQTDAGQ